jgi:N-carbamoyl-L-amino-acid hydrolase
MDEALQKALDRAAERHAPGKHTRMPSGTQAAGGDDVRPLIGRISHHWSENTSDADFVLGAQVFVDAIAEVLQR